MNSSIIKSFSVFGLFGTSDVYIPFDENIKILIGENGLGKTQILNIFYCILTKNFFKLNEFDFKNLILTFSNNKSVEITKENLEIHVKKISENPIAKDLIHEIGPYEFERIRKVYYQNKKTWHKIKETNFNSFNRKYPIRRIFEDLTLLDYNEFSSIEQEIDAEMKDIDVLYFPTYRRVEEDLYNLGSYRRVEEELYSYYNDDILPVSHDSTLIQFGMNDVQKRFETIENNIDKFLKEGLAQFTSDILNVVIDDSKPIDGIFEKIKDDDIDIILSRVGNLLPQAQKDAVKNMVSKKSFKNPLIEYLLQKLIDIYEKQKELDNSVKKFRDVCNRYLINKKVFYDESNIDIFIKSEVTSNKIGLDKLSSGEKQIISIFSKIYLSELDKRFIVLFDEPELSLSILWQKQLLPDIINSKKCEFLLAVTHSPFIFDNELDKYAVGLNEYVDSAKSSTL